MRYIVPNITLSLIQQIQNSMKPERVLIVCMVIASFLNVGNSAKAQQGKGELKSGTNPIGTR